LPLKLLSFSAQLNNSKVELAWKTVAEMNVSHFVVEKSTDGNDFTETGIVFARGNETDITKYNFSDMINSEEEGVLYYRLRSVDIDGSFQFSETRIIRISKLAENNIVITTFPNPVTSEVRINLPTNWQNRKVVYEVLNLNGQVTKKTESASSSQTEAINMSNTAPGFYLVRVSCEGQTAQQKIIKQ
jgi:hypothetical protein